jgi:phenylalanyl-tRNA synthetase beta chain
MITVASNRATQLISELAEGKPLKGIVDVNYCSPPKEFEVNYKKCVSLIGLDIPMDKGEKILTSLNFSIQKGKEQTIKITVPEHRVDVEQTSDISEELARMVGYNTIPSDTRTIFKSEKPLAKIAKCRQRVREILSGAGLLEAYNPSLVSIDLIKSAGVSDEAKELDVIELANASTQDQSVMRTLLYPGLLRNLRHNIAHKAKSVRLFEIGRTYSKTETAGEFNEEERIALHRLM